MTEKKKKKSEVEFSMILKPECFSELPYCKKRLKTKQNKT